MKTSQTFVSSSSVKCVVTDGGRHTSLGHHLDTSPHSLLPHALHFTPGSKQPAVTVTVATDEDAAPRHTRPRVSAVWPCFHIPPAQEMLYKSRPPPTRLPVYTCSVALDITRNGSFNLLFKENVSDKKI